MSTSSSPAISPSGSFAQALTSPRPPPPLVCNYTRDEEVLEKLCKDHLLCASVVFGISKDAHKPFARAMADCILAARSPRMVAARRGSGVPATAPITTESSTTGDPPPDRPPPLLLRSGSNRSSASTIPPPQPMAAERAAELLRLLIEMEFDRSVGRNEPHTFMRGNGLIPTLVDELCSRHVMPEVLLPALRPIVAEACGALPCPAADCSTDGGAGGGGEREAGAAEDANPLRPPVAPDIGLAAMLDFFTKSGASSRAMMPTPMSVSSVTTTFPAVSAPASVAQSPSPSFASAAHAATNVSQLSSSVEAAPAAADGPDETNSNATVLLMSPEETATAAILATLRRFVDILRDSIPSWPPPLRCALDRLCELARDHDQRLLEAGCRTPQLGKWTASGADLAGLGVAGSGSQAKGGGARSRGQSMAKVPQVVVSPPVGGNTSDRSAGAVSGDQCSLKASMLSTIVVLRVVSPALFAALDQVIAAAGLGGDDAAFMPEVLDARKRLTLLVRALQKVASGRCFDAPHESSFACLNEGMRSLTTDLHKVLSELSLSMADLPAASRDQSELNVAATGAAVAAKSSAPRHHAASTTCSRLLLANSAAIIGQMAHHQPVFIGFHETMLHDVVDLLSARCAYYQQLDQRREPGSPSAASTSSGAAAAAGEGGGSPDGKGAARAGRSRISSLLSRRGPSEEALAAARVVQFQQLVAHGYYASAHPHVMQFTHRFINVLGLNASGVPVVAVYGSLLAESLNDFARCATTNRIVIKKLLPLYTSSFDDADIVAHLCSRLDALLLAGVDGDGSTTSSMPATRVPPFMIAFFPAPEHTRCPLGPQWLRNILATVVDERIARACTTIVVYRPPNLSGSASKQNSFLGKLFHRNEEPMDAKPIILSTPGATVITATIQIVQSLHELCAKLDIPTRETCGSSVQLLGLPIPEEIAWQNEALALREAELMRDGVITGAEGYAVQSARDVLSVTVGPSSSPNAGGGSGRPGRAGGGSSRDIVESAAAAGYRDPFHISGGNSPESTCVFAGDFVLIDTWRDNGQVMTSTNAASGESVPLWPVSITVDVLRLVVHIIEAPSLTNKAKYSVAREAFTTLRGFREIRLPEATHETASRLSKSHCSIFGFLQVHTTEDKLLFDSEVMAQIALFRNDTSPSSTHAPRVGLLHVPIKNLWRVLLKQLAVACRACNVTVPIVGASVRLTMGDSTATPPDDVVPPEAVIQTISIEAGASAAQMCSIVCAALAYAAHLLESTCFLPSEFGPEKLAEARQQLVVVLERFFSTDEEVADAAQGTPGANTSAGGTPTAAGVAAAASAAKRTAPPSANAHSDDDEANAGVGGAAAHSESESMLGSTTSSMVAAAVHAMSNRHASQPFFPPEDSPDDDRAMVRLLAASIVGAADKLSLFDALLRFSP